MPSVSGRALRPSGFAPVLLANLLPLVGVLAFGWNPATLLVVYAAEVLVSFPIAALKALFAAKRPQSDRDGVVSVGDAVLTGKRGSVRPVAWLPPIYPRNVPFAASVLGAGAWFGVFAVFPVAAAIGPGAVDWSVAGPSTLALVAGQCIDVWRDYLRDGRYETTSPYAVVETPARQTFLLVVGLFALSELAASTPLLGVFVLVKLGVEYSAFRAAHGDTGRLTGWLAGPDGGAETADPPAVSGPPTLRVRTDRRAVLWAGVTRTADQYLPFYVSGAAFLWLVLVGVLSGIGAPRVVAVGAALGVAVLVVLAAAVRVAAFYLRYGPLEYRRYDDRLVAYDRWLERPQWAVDADTLRDVRVVGRVPDRLLGTRTVTATAGWGDHERTRTFGPVADPDALIEGFGLPVRSAALDPVDRRLALVGGGLAAVSVVTVGALAVADAGALVVVAFAAPFVVLVPRVLWHYANPNSPQSD